MRYVFTRERKRYYVILRCLTVRAFQLTVVFLIVYNVLINCGLLSAIIKFLRQRVDFFFLLDEDRPFFLCIKFQGGLGNLLFQYAFAYAVAKSHNLTMLCTPDDVKQLQQIFYVPNCTRHARGESVCKQLTPRVSQYDCGFDENILKMNKTDQRFEGYFQSWVYWTKQEHIFRKYFKIRKDIQTESESLLLTALNKFGYARSNVSLVGIHIRRGDILTTDYLRKYGYIIPGSGYINNAMTYIRSKVKGTIVYIVCSNDMVWTRKVVKDPNTIFMIGRSREIDFALLASCDHLIMTVGTFGWWIGWNVNGMVIYYDTPFKNGTDLQKKFTKDYRTSLYYANWIGMS